VSVSLRRGCGSTIGQGMLPSRTTTTDGILSDGSFALISGLAQGVSTNIASSTPGKADGQAEQQTDAQTETGSNPDARHGVGEVVNGLGSVCGTHDLVHVPGQLEHEVDTKTGKGGPEDAQCHT